MIRHTKNILFLTIFIAFISCKDKQHFTEKSRFQLNLLKKIKAIKTYYSLALFTQ